MSEKINSCMCLVYMIVITGKVGGIQNYRFSGCRTFWWYLLN